MATIKELAQYAVLMSNKRNLQAFFSDRINIMIGDVSSFEEIYAQNLKVNWYDTTVTADDIKGLYRLNPIELQLNGDPSGFITTIPANSINVGTMKRLQVLKTKQSGNCPFTGNMEGQTQLRVLEVSLSQGVNNLVIPNLSSLPNLTRVVMDGTGLADFSITKLGNLQNNLALEYFKINSSLVSTAIVDNILASLLIAKQAGAPLTTVNLSQCGIPTGGASNTSKNDLITAGVAVTIRTV